MVSRFESKRKNELSANRERLVSERIYPYLSTSSHIHLTPDHAWLLYETQKNPHWNWGLKKLDHLEAEALFLCDGTRTIQEINCVFEKSWRNDLSCDLLSFIEAMSFLGVISFSKKPFSFPTFPSNGGSKDFYVPLHILLELTDSCNQHCKHCYRDSSSDKKGFIKTQRAIDLIESLSSFGSLVCELTGGEPLLHPDFKKIISSCAEHFEVVSIITNGHLVDGKLADFLGSLKYLECQLLASITLNSFEKSFHDNFAETPGSFERACKAISLLSSNDILVRATMNIVPENVTHIEKTAELAFNLGAEAFAAAIIMPFGRGVDFLNTHFSNDEIATFEKSITRLSRKFPGQIITIPETAFDFIEAPNCGAGSRSMVISPYGNVRPCVTMPEEYAIGNILYQKIEECLANPLISAFEKIHAPDEQTCGNCFFFEFCHRCFWRAAIASRVINHCAWKELYSAEISKTNLQIDSYLETYSKIPLPLLESRKNQDDHFL